MVGVIAAPVQQHVANVELVGLGGRPHMVGPTVGGFGVDGDGEATVRVDLHGAAVEDVDGAHVGIPQREVVLGHAVVADPAVNLVTFVTRYRDHPIDAVGIVDAPT